MPVLLAGGIALAIATMPVAGRATAQQPPAYLRQILRSDSGYVPTPAISPDDRWLVLAKDVSESANELWIRPFAGGEERKLIPVPGVFRSPVFSPQGDRLVLLSSLPRREATDDAVYLMMAPFDTHTGTLSAAPRQIALDPVSWQARFRPAIAPDGQRVAYVDEMTGEVRVVPITGGRSVMLVASPPAIPYSRRPGDLVWTADSREVLYSLTGQAGQGIRYRVSAGGGNPVEIARSDTRFGRPIPGGDLTVNLGGSGPGRAGAHIQFVDGSGRPIGELELPGLRISGNATTDGKYLVLPTVSAKSAIRIVSTAGGPIRNTVPPTGYDWPLGWTADSRAVFAVADTVDAPRLRGATADGRVVASLRYPDSVIGGALLGNSIIVSQARRTMPRRLRPGEPQTYFAINTADGALRKVAQGIAHPYCCRAPGGGYGSDGSEFYYARRSARGLEVRALDPEGRDRLVTDLPESAADRQVAVGRGQVAMVEALGDSVRLVLKQSGRPPSVPTTYSRAQIPIMGELSWSRDGHQLLVSLDQGRSLDLYTFNASGQVMAPPRRINLPVLYQYEMFWLPDGSGFTAIVQLRDQAVTHVAVIKLNDPEHPVLLTREDPHFKWGHVLSPDGKYVAYQSDQPTGGSVWLLDVAQALKDVRRRR